MGVRRVSILILQYICIYIHNVGRTQDPPMPRMDGVSPAPFMSLWVPWVCGDSAGPDAARRWDGGSADPLGRLGDVARGGADLASGDTVVWR